MKLSEAIMLGSVWPQCIGAYAIDDKRCALGGALEACGVPLRDAGLFTPQYHLERLWFWAVVDNVPCPVCSSALDRSGPSAWDVLTRSYTLALIPHLNDHHEWSREQIADWVRTIEPEEPVAPTPVAVAEEKACSISEVGVK